MKNLSALIVLLAMWLVMIPARAQEYPVQVTTILTPPYSLYLSDYASPETNAIQLIINLRELDRPEYRVKLRVTIEGQGITLRTRPSYVPPALVLQGGVPEILTGPDLSAYLNPDNLDFSGISKQEFVRKGTFPEGFYTFKVEVVDYVRNVVVSNAGLANAWIILNDPPIINLPFNGEKVIANDPQNVMFSWTPRHSASPNAAFNTEYEFTLVELYPDNRNPNDAIRAANSIFVTQTPLTSLNYSMAEPLLIPGRKYAFRVRAYDIGGRDLFKNNGYSEVHVFQFGDVCVPPTGIKAEALDEARIKVMWDQGEIQTAYGLQYRKKGAGSWEEQSLFTNTVILPGLQGGSTYEYHVKGVCGTLHGEFSNVATIETPAVAEDAFVCGAPMPDIEMKTTPIQGGLRVGDIIKTADFEISLSEITANTDGSYKGFGFAIVPWFKMASARVKFSNIMVNEDYRVYSGNVTTVYNPNSQFVLDVNEAIEEMLPEGGGSQTPGGTPAEPNVVDTVFAGDIETITVNEIGEIVIVDASGTTTTIQRQKDETTADNADDYKETRITDSNGDTYIVGKDGSVRQGPSTAPATTVASADSVDFKVEFLANATQTYGFDKKSEPVLGTTYDQVTIQDGPYDVAWKSIALGGQDIIDAQASGEESFPGTVGFKTETGPVPSQPAPNASQKQLVVTGRMPGEKEVISAVVTVEDSTGTSEIEVGRVNLITYNKLTQKLFVVPVNDAPVPDQASLVREINRVYSQAVAEWDITVDRAFNIDASEVQGLDEEESGTFSSYNAKTKAFNKAFKNDRSFDKDAYYIFLIKGSGSSRSGFMPFKRQFGYVFTDNTTDLITTVAHELGHGAFNLRHTFSSKAFYANQNSTDNLMDYRGGKELRKYQWDFVHDPEAMSGWFQDDEESAQVAIGMSQFVDFKNSQDGSFTFIAPSGKYITLPASTKAVSFSTLDRLFKVSDNTITDVETDNQYPIGSLIGFSDKDGTIYSARLINGSFAGYFKSGTQDKYNDALTGQINPSNGIALFLGVENTKFVSYISKFDAVNGKEPVSSDSYFSAGPNVTDFTILDNLDFVANRNTDFKSWLTSNSKATLQTVANDNFNFSFPNQDVSLIYQIHKEPLKDFLAERLMENKTLQDYLFYFTIINLQTNILEAFDDCTKQQIRLEELRALEAYHRAISAAQSGMSGRLNTALEIRRNFEAATFRELFDKAYKQTEVIAQLEQAVENLAQGQALNDILKMETGVCAYSGMKMETRQYIVKVLLAGDNDYWYVDASYIGSDGNFILKQLMESTPHDQRVELLNTVFLANNSEGLRRLWNQAVAFANGVEFDDALDLIYIIREWVLTNYADLELEISKRSIPTISFDPVSGDISFSQVEYPAGSDVFYLSSAGYDFTFNSTFNGKISPKPEVDFLESGKILLREHIYAEDNTTYIAAPGTEIGRTRDYWYEGSFHPFEPVTLRLVHGADEVSQLPVNETFQDIALMGLVYQNRINTGETNAAIRTLGNSVAIIAAVLAAPETGGSSLLTIANFITKLGGVVGAMDISVQEERDVLIKQGRYNEYQGFFSAWDDFHTAVGVADLGAWGTVGLTKLSKVNIANSAQNLANSIKSTRNLPSKIVKSWNEAWGIVSRENLFITKLEDIGYTFLKNEFVALDATAKSRFLNIFGDESIQVLNALDKNPKLVRSWVKYGNPFKTNSYVTETGVFKSCQSVAEAHSHESYLGGLVRSVMEGNPPSNSEQVIVGVTHPSFEGKVFLARNFKPGEESAKLDFLQECHPILRDRLEYMEFVRTSVMDASGNVTNTTLANELLSIDDLSKLTRAGEAGTHGEVMALSDALYKLDPSGVGLTEQSLAEFDMFIRNTSNNVMQRCPCCFYITSGVKVLGGR